MARGIRRSLVNAAKRPPSEETSPVDHDAGQQEERSGQGLASEDVLPAGFQRSTRGAGSAWKAGAVAQAQAGLDEAREKLARDILCGDQVIDIDPVMISDAIGTDRRSDWMEQAEFGEFVESIRSHGQDMPILVWPEDAGWQPDPVDPADLQGVKFLLLAGRRRTEAARQLGRPVRAVIASQKNRETDESLFEMLALRFRENAERQDLSPFERLVSIGEMYEALNKASNKRIKAKDFAERIGVHESMVSRARAVYGDKHKLLNAFKNVFEMSFAQLQSALAELAKDETKQKAARAKPKKLKVVKKLGNRNLALESVNGNLLVKTSGVTLDKDRLEKLGDLIAEYLSR